MQVKAGMSLAAAGFLAALASVTAAGQNGQGTKSVWDGVYTAAQAERGLQAYSDHCSTCHGADMQAGAGAPSLVGPEFQFSWNTKPVGGVYDYASMYMPPGQPASLASRQYVDIIAAILKQNGFPAGMTELPTSKAELDAITVLTKKP